MKNRENLRNPPVSEASREVANLTERKNLHTLVYGFKEFHVYSKIYTTTA